MQIQAFINIESKKRKELNKGVKAIRTMGKSHAMKNIVLNILFS